MFTGIIKKLSIVEKISQKNGSLFISIKIPKGWKVGKGESISINGVCSTVKNLDKKIFTVEYMSETRKITTAGKFKIGDRINLERSLRVGDLLDGHIVQGHIDAMGEIIEIKNDKKSKIIKIKFPKELAKFVLKKGSISIDGVSLTIVDCGTNWFSVSLVSYTLENTNFGEVKKGDWVNIEIDALAKYLDKLMQSYAKKK